MIGAAPRRSEAAVRPAASPPPPAQSSLLQKATNENFPVALRFLPRRQRHELMAIYGFARFVDDLGDELEGGPAVSLAALDRAEAELDRSFEGTSEHPVFSGLTPVIERHGLSRQPFADLIEANRRDQVTKRYDTFEDLLGYCRLSADPVGRLVLGLTGRADDERAVALSDRVCSGLQIVEHIQDVAEDAVRGRIYLPLEDLRTFGVQEADLAVPTAAYSTTPPHVRRLIAFETGRARDLLRSAAWLAAGLPASWRLAVAGYGGGGLAQVAAIERSGYDVLGPIRPVAATNKARIAGAFRVLRSGWKVGR